MGCSTCKQKKGKKSAEGIDNTDEVEGKSINFMPEAFANGDFNGNILFKMIAFVVITIAIPFIILVLIGQIFFTFFAPKSLPKITKKIKGGFTYIFKKYAKFKYNKEMVKRHNQFGENKGYVENSVLVDIEILDDIKVHENNKNK